MGGMGFIENNKALCMLSVLVNTHVLMMAKEAGVSRFFYSSSACVYAADKQTNPNVTAPKEEDAYPAMPLCGSEEVTFDQLPRTASIPLILKEGRCL